MFVWILSASIEVNNIYLLLITFDTSWLKLVYCWLLKNPALSGWNQFELFTWIHGFIDVNPFSFLFKDFIKSNKWKFIVNNMYTFYWLFSLYERIKFAYRKSDCLNLTVENRLFNHVIYFSWSFVFKCSIYSHRKKNKCIILSQRRLNTQIQWNVFLFGCQIWLSVKSKCFYEQMNTFYMNTN